MPAAISPITPVSLPDLRAPGEASAGGAGFQSLLANAIGGVEGLRQHSNQTVERFLAGEGEVHTVALATQRAELALETFLQIRNKVVSAYQSIMQMQV